MRHQKIEKRRKIREAWNGVKDVLLLILLLSVLINILQTIDISAIRDVFASSRTVIIVNHEPENGSVAEVKAGATETAIRERVDDGGGKEQSSAIATTASDSTEISKLAGVYKISPKDFRSTEKTVQRVASEMNFDWKIPMAIILTESKGGKVMTGDNGLSKGWYHIYHVNVCELNGEKPFCIKDHDRMDLEKSTRWAIARLQRHEGLGREEMIRSHNGLIADNSNSWYPVYVEKLIKEL